eukprot:3712276-Prymnesium_polylepis.3
MLVLHDHREPLKVDDPPQSTALAHLVSRPQSDVLAWFHHAAERRLPVGDEVVAVLAKEVLGEPLGRGAGDRERDGVRSVPWQRVRPRRAGHVQHHAEGLQICAGHVRLVAQSGGFNPREGTRYHP